MANQQHLKLLLHGSNAWNEWRKQHPKVKPDLREAHLREAHLNEAHLSGAHLSGADLSGADLSGADLSGADLREADLSGAHLIEADLSGADLSGADLSGAYLNEAYLNEAYLSGVDLSGADLIETDLREAHLNEAYLIGANLSGANLSGADLSGAHLSGAYLIGAYLSRAHLSGADLSGADLSGADLSGADLSGADLRHATLEKTNFSAATLTQCSVYGISVWNVQLSEAKQENLVITDEGEPTITVDNLEVAQFIYLLLNNAKIRDVINTITTKVVLILGRFTPERKVVLDALREALRQQDYLPVLFDFEKPNSRNFTETVGTLAHLARFIIADLTAPRSIPQELHALIPLLRVPVQPLLHTSEEVYSMFEDLEETYHWVLPPFHYTTLETLLTSLNTNVIEPAERKAQELEKR
jgi:uncharacterized protein YjbI with pentapeptide repeats